MPATNRAETAGGEDRSSQGPNFGGQAEPEPRFGQSRSHPTRLSSLSHNGINGLGQFSLSLLLFRNVKRSYTRGHFGVR